MTDPAITRLLADQLGVDDVSALLDHATVLEVAGGNVLCRDREPLDSLYMLLEGRLDMAVEVAGHGIHLGEITPGNWIGEVTLFSTEDGAVSTVVARGPARLLRLPYGEFMSLAQAAPELACRLAHTLNAMLIQRLRATVNDPILDADGQLLMLGNLSLPLPAHHEHHGVRDFMRKLMGVD